MTNDELRHALITELLNTMPFYKLLELAKGFAEAVAEQQLKDINDAERAQLVARFTPEAPAPVMEEPAPTKKRKKKATTK